MALYYKNVSKAEATGDHEVTFSFDVKGNRELPMIMGQLTILPKHYWTGNDASGTPRDPMKTTLEPPLGSGPYRIKEVKPGRSITYERVPDYWGKDLPCQQGPVELRRGPLRLLPRRDRRLRELQGRQSRLSPGDERQELGDGLRLRCRARRLHQAPGGRHQAHAADAVLRAQFAAPAIRRPPRAPGLQPRLRFRMGQQEPVLRPVCAGRQLFPELGTCGSRRAAAGPRARDPERGEGRGAP